jgi:hypothetical protein
VPTVFKLFYFNPMLYFVPFSELRIPYRDRDGADGLTKSHVPSYVKLGRGLIYMSENFMIFLWT